MKEVSKAKLSIKIAKMNNEITRSWILKFELQIAVWCSNLLQYRHRWLIMRCWCFLKISESCFFMLTIDKFMRFLELKIVTFKSVKNVAYLTRYARTVEITEIKWIIAFDLKRFCTVMQYWLFNCWHLIINCS